MRNDLVSDELVKIAKLIEGAEKDHYKDAMEGLMKDWNTFSRKYIKAMDKMGKYKGSHESYLGASSERGAIVDGWSDMDRVIKKHLLKARSIKLND